MGKSYSKLLQVELRRKHELVNGFLSERGLDGVWLALRPNVAWYTGGIDNWLDLPQTFEVGKPRCLSLLVLRDCTYLLVDSRVSSTDLLLEANTFGWKVCTYDCREPGAEGNLLIGLTANLRIGTDIPHMGLQLLDKELARLSQALMAGEQARYRILCQECTSAVETIARTLIREQSEQQLLHQLTDCCELASITPLHIKIERDRLSRACYRSAWAKNHTPTQVLLHLVAVRGGLKTTVTRMVILGGKLQVAYDTYQAIVELTASYFHLARPGMTMSEVYAQCMTYYGNSPKLHNQRLRLRANMTGYYRPEETQGNAADHELNVNQTIECTVNSGMFGASGTFMMLPDWNEWLTLTNDWPMTSVVLAGRTYYIPDILCL